MDQIVQYVQQIFQAAQSGDQKASKIKEALEFAALGDLRAALAVVLMFGDEQTASAAIQAAALMLQLAQIARSGAKLNYIKHLAGNCPAGTELQYFRVGGKVCKKCVAKAQAGVKVDEEPQDPVEQFKCGRKMKMDKGGKYPIEQNDNTRVNREHHTPMRHPSAPPTGIGHVTGQGWDDEGNYIVRKPNKKLTTTPPQSEYEEDPSAGAPPYDKRFQLQKKNKSKQE